MSLERYKKYDRRELRDFFEPQKKGEKHLGRWQQQGIVEIPGMVNDYAFLVRYGAKQGDYTFDESIDENGILTWQSQPKNSLSTPFIQKLIHHDEQVSTIYLFLATEKKGGYVYVGNLAYVSHDPTKERPVHFKWQILDFNKEALIEAMPSLHIVSQDGMNGDNRTKNQLKETMAPVQIERRGMDRGGMGYHDRDFIHETKMNEALGEAGERAILKIEKERLEKAGKKELLNQLYLTRDTLGNTAPYDIHSCDLDGKEIFIEVKTTKGDINTPFYISSKEILQSIKYAEQYQLYRVFDFDLATESGQYYTLHGDLTQVLDLEPIQFTARKTEEQNNILKQYWERLRGKY